MTAKSGGDILVLDEVIAEMFGDAGPGNRLIEGWRDQEAALREHGPMVRVLLTGGTSPIDDTILDCLPQLGLIACLGAGFEGIDLQATGRRGIEVVNAPGSNAPDVADVAVAMLLNLLCGLPAAHRHVAHGLWMDSGRMPLRPSLRGRAIGLVGMGAIGRAVADRLAPFGMTLRWWAPRDKPECPLPRAASLADLARESEALILCCRADASSRGMVDRTILAALGPQGILVNVARGMVVDENALRTALLERSIAGAGLDVFDGEPTPPERWHDVPNVLLSPHIGGSTIESIARQGEIIRRNIRLFFGGQAIETPVPGQSIRRQA